MGEMGEIGEIGREIGREIEASKEKKMPRGARTALPLKTARALPMTRHRRPAGGVGRRLWRLWRHRRLVGG